METPEPLGDPQPEIVERMGTENAIYGNVFTGNTLDAVDFFSESHKPGHPANPLPEDQRALCGNLFDGFSDAEPETSCPTDLPSGDGVGHLGGDRPWDGDAPTKTEVFERDAMAQNLDTTVEATDAPTGERFEAIVTVKNTGDSPQEVILRLRVDDSVLESATLDVQAGKTRTFEFGHSLPNPDEVAITRNGQKIGYMRVRDN